MSNTTAQRSAVKLPPNARKALISATVGTLIEWYDFALYGAAAGIVIGPLFFPDQEGAYGTLASLATFAVGFVVRPIGGLVIGHIGDRAGRKTAMILTITLMGIGTVGIGLLPTTHSAGIVAAILLILLRALQGFGAGAELSGALTVVSEFTSERVRGLMTGLVNGSAGLGTMIATLMFILMSQMPTERFMEWGWRIPFLLSFVLFLLALYMRKRLEETPEFVTALERQDEKNQHIPLRRLWRGGRWHTVRAILAWSGHGAIYFTVSVFSLSYMTTSVGMDRGEALTALMIGAFAFSICTPLMGMLADRVGYRQVYLGAMVGVILFSYPFFAMLRTGNFLMCTLAISIGYGIITAASGGSNGAYTANLFPAEYRFTGVAVAKEVNAALVAGPAPFIATFLIAVPRIGIWLVAGYISAMALITIGAVLASGGNVGNRPPSEIED
ncbi:MFS transporter [Brevibacterium sp. 'Marine']|uniref:MFS transporter n=1 Tax=Brevibacterium sp. 'Marine' TaxID=2725563 RepID=UPI002006E29A|nr:MFS transporter [Brevibacterium sp. 'Marine']